MILTFKLTSEFRGGLHGEAPASHDEKKTNGEEDDEEICETKEVEARREERTEGSTHIEQDEQSQHSNENADESVETDGGFGMTETPANLPKTSGQVAKVLGNLTNDPRITNLLMLVIIAVGFGVHESIQTHVCSL